MKRLAVKYDWDIEELEKVKNKILELNYRNEFVYIKRVVRIKNTYVI